MDNRTVVVNLRAEPYDVYIGRPGRNQDGYFGNPFRIGVDGSRPEVIEKFRRHFVARLDKDPEYRRRIEELRGMRLGCFCHSLACHGDVIADYLNGGGTK